jgi:hypothetical protein
MSFIRNMLGGVLLACAAGAGATEPIKLLFVGNSFTYTRPPALQYNVENVTDLNELNAIALPLGSDPALPQPWGGVPGIFKAMADQAGLAYDVSHSLRGGATLRGHLINSNPAGWDMRANIASDRWDVVVLQGNSTEALNRAGGSYLQFKGYVGLLSRFITDGTAFSFRDRDLFPGATTAAQTAACVAETGLSSGSCNLQRPIPANPNANPQAQIYLYQTWARPDLTYLPDRAYSGQPLETMANELVDAYAGAALANDKVVDVVPVGEAFMRAIDDGVAMRNPYEPTPRTLDLWWEEDQFHSSVYGSYLSALVMFGSLTGIDPAAFGATEKAANDLGIHPLDAMRLQRVASEQLAAAGQVLDKRACLHAHPRSQGARACSAQ